MIFIIYVVFCYIVAFVIATILTAMDTWRDWEKHDDYRMGMVPAMLAVAPIGFPIMCVVFVFLSPIYLGRYLRKNKDRWMEDLIKKGADTINKVVK